MEMGTITKVSNYAIQTEASAMQSYATFKVY
jgi:hypothetical protein